jgi:hypothetical protein
MARAQTLGLALERRVIKSSLRSVGTLSRPYETVFRLARHEFKTRFTSAGSSTRCSLRDSRALPIRADALFQTAGLFEKGIGRDIKSAHNWPEFSSKN